MSDEREELDPLTAEELTDVVGRHAKAMLERCMQGEDSAEDLAFRGPDGRKMVLSVSSGVHANALHDRVVADPDGLIDDEPEAAPEPATTP